MIAKIQSKLPQTLIIAADDNNHYLRWDRKTYSAAMIAANVGVDESEIVKSTYHYSVSIKKEQEKNGNPPTR